MKFFVLACFCSVFLVGTAQKSNFAVLSLVYPAQFTYDTLLVKDSGGQSLLPKSKIIKGGVKTEVYLMSINEFAESFFSIYFGGSLTAVNDTLYFLGRGNSLQIEIRDAFALRNNINFWLLNTYNFEELYNRYDRYINLEMQNYRYSGKMNNISSEQEYSLKTRLNFVKQNLNNPYTIDLFSFFVINPKAYSEYNAIHQFYINHLKDRIKDPKIKILVESKIEHLRQSLGEGNLVPAFSVLTIQNQRINSLALYGKNVLVIFWATWCVPCIEELPSLKKIHEEYKRDSLMIIGISLDNDSLKMVNFINERNLDWMHVFKDRSMLELFRVNPIPATFLIDENGIILYNTANRASETLDLKILRSVLKEKFMH